MPLIRKPPPGEKETSVTPARPYPRQTESSRTSDSRKRVGFDDMDRRTPDRMSRESTPETLVRSSTRASAKEECTMRDHRNLESKLADAKEELHGVKEEIQRLKAELRETKKDLEEVQDALVERKKDYDEVYDQLEEQDKIMSDPRKYRKKFKKEFNGDDIFDLLEDEIITHLKGKGVWPSSGRAASPQRSTNSVIKPFAARVSRISTMRLTPSS